ncbi:MAG: LysM peptidoglycan-binding domain-containing protein [Bacteroidales bacterium]
MKHFTQLLFIIFLFFSFSSIEAQEPEKEIELIEDQFKQNIDDLLDEWYNTKYKIKKDSFNLPLKPTAGIEEPDSFYIERLKKLPSVIELNYNKIVRNFIHIYTIEQRERVQLMLGLSEYYFPIFERIFDQYELPHELKYLAIIESALNPKAVSRMGATGMWQFMYGTGRMYDLSINSFIDERRDPVKSTYAAAEYLRDLYGMFGEWDLAIAAYNCGPRNVNKAIYRAGGKKNFWDIYYYLPRETRGYYPAFIAAMYFMNYYEDHNLYPKEIELPLATDTVKVKKQVHLQQIAEVLNVPVKELEDLNPQYRRNIIPAKGQEYAVKLPQKITGNFIQMEDSIYNYKKENFFADNLHKEPSSRSRFVPQVPDGTLKLVYTVKPGDNLGHIAEWYNVRASQLRYWNNLRGNLIRVGQKLNVYVPRDKVEYYKAVNSLPFEEKQQRSGQPVSASTSSDKETKKEDGYIYYEVKNGDTLWEISKKHPGVTQNQLLQLNNIQNGKNLRPGQTLKIKKET